MKIKLTIALLLCVFVVTSHEDVLGRGFGGGGGRGGGGGGISRGGGGGGGARPSMSRPSGGGGARPSMGASRPNMGGGSHPSIGGGSRPNVGGAGGAGNRPNMGGGNRPNIGGGNPIAGGNRPNIGGGNRPEIGGGNRPGIGTGNRPGTLPGLGGGNRPGIGEGNRPGFGDGNRPGVRPGAGGSGERNPIANLPGMRPGAGGSGERNPIGNLPGMRPGQGGSGERNPFINNRPGSGNHPNIGNNNGNNFGNRIGNNTHIGNNNFGHNNFNNVNINNSHNFAVGNGHNWNNNWHHGYWGGGNWGGGAAWGYRAGYRNGYWNGYANRSWYRPWYGNAAVWGLSAWALGSVYYDSGYASYSNPYYVSNAGYYNYSQPIQVVAQPEQVVVAQDPSTLTDQTQPQPQPPPQVQASLTHTDAARDAFMAGDYVKAGTEVDLAIKDQPTDAALHEFRALIYFAVADYQKAAASLYAVLSAGPGWDWTTMSSLYPSVETYTTQLRALEQYARQKPSAADAHFVLAYHYITGTHKEAAIKQLQEVARLQPSDQLTVQLIKGLGGEVPTQPGASQQPTPMPPPAADPQLAGDDQPPPPDIDPAKIIGRRTAKRSDGTTFTLDLTSDNKFTWSFERAGKKQSFGGTYTVDGAVLVLEREDKATMPGLVTIEGTGFNFKLFGTPEDDPGLDFKA
ncbi:MAG: hypothetical protein JWP89_4682 [Schlesneria sp.]|nr:hypothetical protein [Schlesneria sp.]